VDKVEIIVDGLIEVNCVERITLRELMTGTHEL
jgi:hypothetical protein